MEARRELTEAVRQRHLSAGRTEKRRILDEFAEMAGYHRKYAIRVLGNGHRKESSSQQPERRIYNEAVITALTILWEAADRICGKRLKAVLPTFVESMEHHGHLCLDVEVRERLLRISAATIDRLLRPARASAKQGRRRASLNTPLRKSINIRTYEALSTWCMCQQAGRSFCNFLGWLSCSGRPHRPRLQIGFPAWLDCE